jgi:hypothetical protein
LIVADVDGEHPSGLDDSEPDLAHVHTGAASDLEHLVAEPSIERVEDGDTSSDQVLAAGQPLLDDGHVPVVQRALRT